MPELPEVETIRKGLAETVANRTVERVQVLHQRPLHKHLAGVQDFVARMTGAQFGIPQRRGKFLWIPLSNTASEDVLLAHLGMSGQFRINTPDVPLQRHTRIIFDLDDGGQLRFVDQRMFGGLRVCNGGVNGPAEISHIALDPLDPNFDREAAVAKLRAKKSEIKRVLLDQSWVSGIGNIYADESLWRTRLHPQQSCATVSARKAGQLIDNVQQVLNEAIAQGGTSFDALYVHVNGESGYFAHTLNAYGRQGQPCKRCDTLLVKCQFGNRSATFCPTCQRLRSH